MSPPKRKNRLGSPEDPPAILLEFSQIATAVAELDIGDVEELHGGELLGWDLHRDVLALLTVAHGELHLHHVLGGLGVELVDEAGVQREFSLMRW